MTNMGRGAVNGGSLTVDLFSPGMTALHRVGLAGLAMTLEALNSDPAIGPLRALGSWTISDHRVTLDWTGDGKAFFAALIAASFRLTGSGLIWFPALGHPGDHPGQAVVLHAAMLGTFLQHNLTRKTSAKKAVGMSVELDGVSHAMSFLPLSGYAHQGVVFDPARRMRVAGWLFPGGVVRHVQATAATALEEDPARALALRYAPVGAIYFQVHREKAGVKPQYCLVLPAVADLRQYATARQLFLRQGIARLQVAGPAEAAARAMAELEAFGLLRKVVADRCEVIAFGTAAWSKQQKTRVERFTVTGVPREEILAWRAAVPAPKLVEGKADPKTGEIRRWWVVPQVPDLAARNLLVGIPWWRGLADLWGRVRQGAKAGQRDWALQDENERRGLQLMVGDGRMTPLGPEARLVRACHEAWRRRLGELGERARRQGLDYHAMVSRERERTRISFARCKNAAMLRQTVTDFWSRAGGSLPDLQEAWPDLLPLLGDRWRDARDLALLSLASYKPETKPEAETLAAVGNGHQEEA